MSHPAAHLLANTWVQLLWCQHCPSGIKPTTKGPDSRTQLKYLLVTQTNIPPKVRNTSKGTSSKQDLTSSQPNSGPTPTDKRMLSQNLCQEGQGNPPLGSAEECATQEWQELNPNKPTPCSPSSLGHSPCPPPGRSGY